MARGAKIVAMPFRYQSGEEVLAGDRILYASQQGTIEFVATAEDPKYAWYLEQYGGGCMILVAPFGSLFVSDPRNDEELDFVSRGEADSVSQQDS
jgi:hypothetical protein